MPRRRARENGGSWQRRRPLVILAEPAIATGDCRIEWADGGVVLERAAIEAKINELVGRYMASRHQAGT
jgi:flagellar assembly protein FliH